MATQGILQALATTPTSPAGRSSRMRKLLFSSLRRAVTFPMLICAHCYLLMTVTSIDNVNKKYTWWHPSRGTGHILDHIVTPQAQRKYIDMVKTVHEGRRGNAGDPLGQTHRQKRSHPNSDYWDDYTDHLPVEVKMHHFPKWKKQRMEENTPARKPNVSLLSCTGPQSQQLKKDWQDKMDLALQNAGGQQQQLSWEILTNICIDTGCQVLGETPTNHKRPHY